jgi:anti-sigma regulatory factor (Ser/Thr protein kinase)
VAVREEKGLRPGGLGILIAKKLVDELIYDKKGNDVLLIKYLSLASDKSQLHDGNSEEYIYEAHK